MLVVGVAEMVDYGVVDLCGSDLAVGRGEREYLVAAMLHGPGLVDVDMRRFGAEDTLVRLENGRDDGGVGLRAADQEVNVGVQAAAGAPDEFARLRAVLVLAVSYGLDHIGFLKALHDAGKRALTIVACEKGFHNQVVLSE